MRSETSYSKKTLFYPVLWKKNMTRFWPIWAVCGLCWLFALPLEILISRGGWVGDMPYPRYFADVVVMELINPGCVLSALVFGILAAMAVFSYLYSPRSVGLFHALPVRREGLFLTNYLSGLSFMALPALAVFLTTALVEAALGALNLGALSMWLAVQLLLALFFYSFAVFCAMFTGHTLALPAFYGILNGLALGMALLVNQVLRSFVFGFESVDLLERAATWLTPAYQLFAQLYVEERWNGAGDVLTRVAFHGLGYVLAYALAGLVLAGIALALYRRRDLEGAGDVVTVRWVRPVFKYGVAFCSALSLGLMLYTFFEYSLPQGAWTLLVFMLLCGWVGYFAAEMLLKKSFRVFAGGWKGCLVFTLCVAAITAGMELDVTGYERRVPDAARVASVSLDGVYSAPYDGGNHGGLDSEDPEVIEALTGLHTAIVRERALHEGADHGGSYEERTLSGGLRLESVQTEGSTQVRLRYTLANGSLMTRNYTIWIREADLDDPDSAAARLAAFINRPEVVEEQYFRRLEDGSRLTGVTLDLRDEESVYDTYPVPTAYRDELMAAIRDDIAAGRLGIRYLLEDEARLTNCYVTDLTLSYVHDSASREVGYETGVRVTLQATAVETLEVLREAGVLDGEHPLETQAQRQQRLEEENRGPGPDTEAVYAQPVR